VGPTRDSIDYWFPEIDPSHIETEETVQIFHGAFYNMVEAKYGEETARRLLGLTQQKARELHKWQCAEILWEWIKSGLPRPEFAKQKYGAGWEAADRKMRRSLKDKQIRKLLLTLEAEESAL
jgi:hypothetical protein